MYNRATVSTVLRKTLNTRNFTPYHMPMPKELQIHTLKRIFSAYNRNSDPQTIDWGAVDGKLELPENKDVLSEMYPQFCWSKHDVEVGGGIVLDRREIEYDLKEMGEEEEISEERRFTKSVIVRSHRIKSKGKTYERGRIQISTSPKFIGHQARVEVEVLVPKEGRPLTDEELEWIFGEDTQEAKP